MNALRRGLCRAPTAARALRTVRHRSTDAAPAVSEAATSFAAAASVTPPTRSQLMTLSLASGLPFVGFGFADNFIMIIVGDQIDGTLGPLHPSMRDPAR